MKTNLEQVKKQVITLLGDAGQRSGNLAQALEIAFNENLVEQGYTRNTKGLWEDANGNSPVELKSLEHSKSVLVESLKQVHQDSSSLVKTLFNTL